MTIHKMITVVLSLLLGLVLAKKATALHEIRPGLLVIEETTPGWYDVTWKCPSKGNRLLPLTPQLPKCLVLVGLPADRMVGGALIRRMTYRSGEPLAGKTVNIEGLGSLQIDVIVRIILLSGGTHSTILRPASPSLVIPERASTSAVAWAYLRLGVIHILEGVDHLLFLLAMLVLISGFGQLLKTITAFTLAHSLTLALASLGVVHLPTGATEAVIALSIVLLAVEIVRKRSGEDVFTARHPWVIAFFFGLFHGLGFAGALSRIGLPEHEVPMALLTFNVGVELGQIVFVSATVLVLAILRALLYRLNLPRFQSAWRVMPYAIGSVAAFWTIQRTLAM